MAGTNTTNTIFIFPSVPVILNSSNPVARVGFSTNWQMVAGGFGREWAGWDDFSANSPSTNNWKLSHGNPPIQVNQNYRQTNGYATFFSTNPRGESTGMIFWKQPLPSFQSWRVVVSAGFVPSSFRVAGSGSVEGLIGVWPNVNSPRSKYVMNLAVDSNTFYSVPNWGVNSSRVGATDDELRVDHGLASSLLFLDYDAGQKTLTGSYADSSQPFQISQAKNLSTTNWQGLSQFVLILGGYSEDATIPLGTLRMDDLLVLPDPNFIRYSATLANGDPLPSAMTVDANSGQIGWSDSSDVSGGFYDVRLAAEYTQDGTAAYDPPIRGSRDVRVTVLPTFSVESPVRLVIGSTLNTNFLSVGSHSFGSTNLLFVATNLPPGLVINPITGVITGRPSLTGLFTPTFSLAAGGASVTQPATFRVLPDTDQDGIADEDDETPNGVPPTILSFRVGQGLTNEETVPFGDLARAYWWTTNGSNLPLGLVTDPLARSFQIGGLPSGVGHSPVTGTISGRPSTVGFYNLTVVARQSTNAGVVASTNSFTVGVTGVGNTDTDGDGTRDLDDETPLGVPPEFGEMAPLFGEVGVPLAPAYQVVTTTDPLARNFTATGLPPGLTLNVSNGLISGTPTNAGIYSWTVAARQRINCFPATNTFQATIAGTRITNLPFSDAFSNNVPNRYLFSSTNSLPRMIVTNGQLEYRANLTATSPAYATPNLLLPLNSSWDLQVDARVPATWPGDKEGRVGVSILKHVPQTGFEGIYPNRLNLKLVAGSEGTRLECQTHINGEEVRGTEQPVAGATNARLRFLFNGLNRKIFAYYSTNAGPNYSWTPLYEESLGEEEGSLGSSWGLGATNRLILALWGETDSEDGNANGARRLALDNLSVGPVVVPRLVGNLSFAGQVGVNFTNQLVATNNQTFFLASNLPAGLTLDTNSGVISGVPETAGRFTNAVLGAGNAAGGSNSPASFTIFPAITSPTGATNWVNDASFRYDLTLGDHPFGSTIRFAATNLPTGTAINTNTGVITGRPTVAGLYRPTLTMSVTGASVVYTNLLFNIRGAAGGAFTMTLNPRPTNVTGLPPGLNYNRTSGVVSGIPQVWGEFPLVGQLAGTNTTNFTVQIMPSIPVISGPTNWTVQLGQPTRFQFVAGGFGREWAGWDDFNGANLSTNWLSSGSLAALRTNAATRSGVGLHQGRLALIHQGATNQDGSGLLAWGPTVPLGARWAATAQLGISTNLNLVRRTNNLGQPINGQWICMRLNVLPAGNELNETRQLTAEFDRSPEDGNLVLARTNSSAELGRQVTGADTARVALRYNDSGNLSSLGQPEGEPSLQSLHSFPISGWGLTATNRLRLVLGGFSEAFRLQAGQVWADNFLLLPDPDDIEYRAFLMGTNGLPMTNNMGEPYLPDGLSCDIQTGTIQGTTDANFPPGIYQIRLQAEYRTNNLPVQSAPLIRGFADLRFTLNPSIPVLTLAPSTQPTLVLSNSYSNVLQVGVNPSGQNTNVYRITYGAVGLPEGLAISTNTGVVTGRPTVAGLYRTRLTAANVSGTGFLDIDLPVDLTTNGSLFNVGTPVSFRVGFGGGSNYASSNLPSGLSINAGNGLITGVPQGAGTNSLTVTARGPGNVMLSTNLTFVIRPSAPVITSPTNVVARAGQDFLYQIVAGGFGREWAGFDNFDTTNAANWGVATNVAGSSLVRTNRQLEFRPGVGTSAYQASHVYWTRPAPTHTSWLAYVDGWVSTNRMIPTNQYGKAQLVAVQINGTNFNPAVQTPLIENIAHSKLYRDSNGSRQEGEMTIGDVPWSGDFSSALDPADYQSLALRSGVSLAPTNGQLRFRSGGGTTNDQLALVAPNLRLTLSRDWTVELDAQIANGWSTSYSGIGYLVLKELPGVTNVTAANLAAWGSNRYNVKLGRSSGGNYLGAHSFAAGSEVFDSPDVSVPGTNARLRLRYQTSGMTLIAEGSQDGGNSYTELDRSSLDPALPGSLGQRWGLSGTNARLRLALWGETYNTGGTGTNLMALDNLNITIDPPKQTRPAQDWSICAVGFDRETQEIISYGWDYGGQQLTELVRTSVADWGLTPTSSFALVIGGHQQWAGMTQGEVGFDNFALIPSKGFTYSAENLPPGLTFDPQTGTIGGVPTSTGTFDVPVSVTGDGGTDTRTVKIQISGAFSILLPDSVNTTVDGNFQQILFADIPGVTWSIDTLPSWLGFNPESGVLSGNPGVGDAGTHNVEVTGSIMIGGTTYTANKTIRIVVTDPGAPTLSLSTSNAPGLNASIRANVAGLPNGRNVRLTLYWDANENGRVDLGEPPVFSYDIPNGGDYKVGSSSTRNPIRPWDLDGAVNTSVQAELADGRQTVWGQLVGKFVLRASDPNATPSFRPAQAPLVLNLPAKGQRVSGTLTNAMGEPLGGSVAVIQHMDSAVQYVVFTRTNGAWSAPLDPGDYTVSYHVLTPNNYEAPSAGESSFTLGAGQELTVNGLAQKVATPRLLQGRAVDTSGNPIRGTILSARQGRTLEMLGLSDENGNFSIRVEPGTWTLQLSGISVSSLGLSGFGPSLAPIFDLTSGDRIGITAVLATPVTSMITGTVVTKGGKNLQGLSLSLDTDDYQADFMLQAGGSFFITALGGNRKIDVSQEDCTRLGVIAPQENPVLTFPASGTTNLGSVTLDTGTLKITGRFVDLDGAPVEGMTVVANRWGQTSGNPVAESRTRGSGYFAAWVQTNQNYTLSQYGPRERTPTHIFFPVPLPSRGPGTNALGDVVCYPLDEFVSVTPVNGADGSTLSGDLRSRALAPNMWMTVDFNEDRGVLWGVRELVRNGRQDPLRVNDTNTLSQIREVCRSEVIRDFFSSNSAATNFSISLPGGVNTSIRKVDWNTIDEQINWNATNEAINLPAALEISLPSQNGVFAIPITRKLTNHPAASWSGLSIGFNYDGGQAVRQRVLGQWNYWSDSDTNSQINHSVRDISTNRMIRVQYVTANGTPIPYRWLGYGIYEYGDPNRWGYKGMEYSGGDETDGNGFVNFPAYESWSDWRVTDWEGYPQPEGGVRVVGATNSLILRQYSTKTITGLGASTVAPGGTLRVNGSNLEQVGAGWIGRARIVPETETGANSGYGISLHILARTQNSFDVGIPAYLANGRYKIRLDNNPYLYTPVFTVSGSRNVNVTKLDTDRISVSCPNLVAGYGFGSLTAVLSNQATSWTYQLQMASASGANAAVLEKSYWVGEIPSGNYQLWFSVSGFNGGNWMEQTSFGPFGDLSF